MLSVYNILRVFKDHLAPVNGECSRVIVGSAANQSLTPGEGVGAGRFIGVYYWWIREMGWGLGCTTVGCTCCTCRVISQLVSDFANHWHCPFRHFGHGCKKLSVESHHIVMLTLSFRFLLSLGFELTRLFVLYSHSISTGGGGSTLLMSVHPLILAKCSQNRQTKIDKDRQR